MQQQAYPAGLLSSSLDAVSTFGIAIIGAEWRVCKLPLLGVIVRNLPWHAATNELQQQINLAAPERELSLCLFASLTLL